MNKSKAKQYLEFFHFAEGAKKTLRHAYTSSPRRQESVAEHSFRMIIMAMALASEFKSKINLEKLLKLIAIHDLPEIITGDTPYWLIENNSKKCEDKKKNEKEAMNKIRKMLPTKIGKEFYNLWHEYEKRKSLEAKICKVLDNQDVRMQHAEEGIRHWHPKEYGLETINAGEQNLNFPEAKALMPLINLIKQELIEEHNINKVEIK